MFLLHLRTNVIEMHITWVYHRMMYSFHEVTLECHTYSAYQKIVLLWNHRHLSHQVP